MKYLKLFEGYQTESEVAEICKKYGIKNWTLNSDGLVDVDGSVYLSYNVLTKIPLKFGEVTGDFKCDSNRLTSLEGAPHTVSHFFCNNNILDSLEFAPKSVGGNFNCDKNQLTSLEGAPHTVDGFFSCDDNQLTSLEFAPKSVAGDFWCLNNNIRSFEGLVNIKGNFECDVNPLIEIWKIISPDTTDELVDEWDNEKMEFFNELDIIRGEEIAIERFNFFLEEIGLPTVEEVRGYKNIY